MSRRRRRRFRPGLFRRYWAQKKEILTEHRREASSEKTFNRRASLLLLGQMGILGLLSLKLYGIQVVQSDEFAEKARRNRLLRRFLVPPRGVIYDCSGKQPLAANKSVVRAVLSANGGIDIDAAIARFEKIIEMDERDHLRVRHQRKHGGKNMTLTLRNTLTQREIAQISQELPPIAGLSLDEGFSRNYPFGALTAHAVGYVAVPNEKDLQRNEVYALPGIKIGRGGIEQAKEELLRGTPGNLEEEVNARRDFIRQLSSSSPIPGGDVHLTLDVRFQEKVKERIGERVASAVVLDCRSGAVRAMVSNPSFDPGAFEEGVSVAQWKSWIEDPATPLNNKAISGFYPPGSTFKPAVALAALQSGALRPEEFIDCPGYFDIGGVRFHCWKPGGHGPLNVRDALKYSCDVFFYQAARRCGMEEIHKAAQALGLCVRPEIELPNAGTGIVPNAEWIEKHHYLWKIGDTINAGIGQGYVQTTPLGLAGYAASLATGLKISPYIIEEPAHCSGRACHAGLPFDPFYLRLVRQGMWDVVNAKHGTAPLARLHSENLQMAGKTGTSQVRGVSRAMRESGHFNSMNLPWKYRPHALFIAYAPFVRPRYALSLVIEHGNAGAAEAAPVAGHIMADILKLDKDFSALL